jgi:phosphoglycerol transferase MdoB-like AlkP superfamily enzyme
LNKNKRWQDLLIGFEKIRNVIVIAMISHSQLGRIASVGKKHVIDDKLNYDIQFLPDVYMKCKKKRQL